ncbi:MAG: DUF4364 family protein [Clostridia bacterium]|nr:DUF4364 family protein [Clostridia bacterium]
MDIPLLQDKTDIKIFILSLLSGITDPLTYGTIQEIICRGGRVNAFDFAQCFSELEELNLIIGDMGIDEKVYQVSRSGLEVASELQSSIAQNIRRAAEVEASRLLSLREQGAEVKCEIETISPCHYLIKCQITDLKGQLLKVEYRVTSLATAEKMKEHFREAPEVVVQGMLSLLTGDVDYLFE